MTTLAVTILIMAVAGIAAAEDTVGLWQEHIGEYRRWIPAEEVTTPFTLLIGLHDPSVATVGGYELGMELPADMLIIEASGPNGWTNFGDAANHLVGYTTPLPVSGEPFTVLGEFLSLFVAVPNGPRYLYFHGADPPSIPGHDGPVIADGADPEQLIPCGIHGDTPWVFQFSGWVPVENRNWTGVKALFD